MLRPWTYVGFTGHRTLERPWLIASKIDESLHRVASYSGAPLAAISSAAKGADTLFVEAVSKEGLPWTLLLPFPSERFFNAEDFAEEDLRRIEPLVKTAVAVQVEDQMGVCQPGVMPESGEAFKACSLRMVDECDYLIAVWNGAPGLAGGTADTLAYARALSRPLILIHAVTGEISEENIPEGAKRPHTRMSSARLEAVDRGLEEMQQTLAHYDSLALKHAPEARDLISRVILLHLLATAVGLFAPVFGILTWLALLPALFKIVVLSYAGRLGHRQQQAKTEWLRHRLIAELCRSALGTWSLPCSERIMTPLRIPGLRDWQRSLLLWRRMWPPAPSSFEAQRDAYLHARFDSPESGQIPYFEKHYKRAKHRHHRWHRLAEWSTGIAIFCGSAVLLKSVVFLFIAEPGAAPHYWWVDLLKYLSLVLPLASAAIFSWLASSDCRRRVERNAEILSQLQALRMRIQSCTTWSALERHASETEALLLLEILEWHSLSNYTANAH